MHPHPHSPWQQPFARLSASCPLQTGRGSQCFLFIRKELYRYFLFRILDRNFCYERNSWPGHQIVLMKLKLMWVWRGYLGFMIFYLKQFIIYSLPVAPFDTNFFKSSFIYRFVAISGSLKSSSIASCLYGVLTLSSVIHFIQNLLTHSTGTGFRFHL